MSVAISILPQKIPLPNQAGTPNVSQNLILAENLCRAGPSPGHRSTAISYLTSYVLCFYTIEEKNIYLSIVSIVVILCVCVNILKKNGTRIAVIEPEEWESLGKNKQGLPLEKILFSVRGLFVLVGYGRGGPQRPV